MPSLVSKVIVDIKANPDYLKDRAFFYQLRDVFDHVRTNFGDGAAFGMSAELYRAVCPFNVPWEPYQGVRRIFNNAKRISTPPPEIAMAGWLGLLNKLDNPAEWLGHPRWHIDNPWGLIWLRAKADTSRVAEHWTQGAASSSPRDRAYVTGLYRTFCATPNPGRDEFGKLILDFTVENGRPPRILDIGCGYGNWLRWCVDHCGVPPENVWGADHLQARVDASWLLLREASVPAMNLWRWTGAPHAADIVKPDIVLLAAVTGAMTDEALPAFLSAVAAYKAPLVFETHAIDSAPAWIGRPNSDKFFAGAGYKPKGHKLLGDPIAEENLASLVLPAKYFFALRCATYVATPWSSEGVP